MRWNVWSSCVFPRREHLSRAFQVLRRVDAEGRGVDKRDIDPHTRLHRPQLLEFLAPLQRRSGQADKSLKRIAAISVKTDVVQEAALAPATAASGELSPSQAS